MFSEFKTFRRMGFASIVLTVLLTVLGLILLPLSGVLSGFDAGTRRALAFVVDTAFSLQITLVLCRHLYSRGWLAPTEREKAAIRWREAPRPVLPPPSTASKVIWIGGIWSVAIFMLLSPFVLSKQGTFYVGVTVLAGLACLYLFFRVMRWRRETRQARGSAAAGR